jgi:signal transduction histidine kinase
MTQPTNFERIGKLLRDKERVLLERWTERVLADPAVPAADRLASPALLDHFPALLDRLALALERAPHTCERPSAIGATVGDSAASHAHASDRFAEGFTLAEVVRELSHLRAAVLELYAVERLPLELDAGRVIHSAIDEMMALGAREMARLDNEAIGAQVRLAQSEHRRAEEANRMKDLFLATLSHELRTPLNAILGWTRILRTKALEEANYERALEAIERNAFAQARLVDELLDMSRITSGKLRIALLPLDVVEVARAAVEELRPSALAKDIGMETSGAASVLVLGDAIRLKQVLWNLLTNAIKFSARGDVVEVRLGVEDRCALVQVIDRGDGIEPEFLDQIFERFRQVDMSTTRQHGGLGLGLAIARELVELHDGVIHAQSAGRGQGATFSIRLPLAREGATRAP